MQIISMTDDSARVQSVVLPDGSAFVMSVYYVPMQYGWFFREITYGDFTLSNLRITNHPNMLHQFRNLLPFGIACFSKDAREPTQQGDFSSLASVLYLLNQTEIDQYNEILSGSVDI